MFTLNCKFSVQPSLGIQARSLNTQTDAFMTLGQLGQAEQTVQALNTLIHQLEPDTDQRSFLLTQTKVFMNLGQADKAVEILEPLVQSAIQSQI